MHVYFLDKLRIDHPVLSNCNHSAIHGKKNEAVHLSKFALSKYYSEVLSVKSIGVND